MQETQRLRSGPDDKYSNVPLNMKAITTDEAIERVGGNNCFQCYVALILTSCFCITGMTSLGLPWLEKQPDPVECLKNGKYEVCKWEDACQLGRDHFRYDMDKAILNWRTDFKLECADDRIIAFMGSGYFLGWMVTAPIWLRLADVWGRRLMIHISIIPHLILTAAFFLVTPSNANWLIIFINVMIGLKESMTSIVAYVLLSEMVSSRYRAYYSAANNIYDGLQNILISVMFYFGRDWHYVSYYYIAVLVLLFFVLFLVPESPRFLLSRKKYNKARAVYARIARINGREMFTEPLEGEVEGHESSHQRNSVTSDDSASSKGYYSHPKVEGLKYGSMKAFFKAGCALWFPLSLLLIMWITVNIVFYGIQVGVKDFKGNMLATTSLSAVADMIGYTLAGFGANYLGRKPSLILGFSLAAVACLLYTIFAPATWAIYLSVALGKLGISFCFNVMYIVTAETYSTEYRGTVFGAANFFARGGGFLAPIVEQLLTNSFMFIFTVLSALSAVLVICLRETRDLRMPDSLDEFFEPKKAKKDRGNSVQAMGLPEED